MVKICWTGLLKKNFEIIPKKTHFPGFAKNFRRPWMKLKFFFCQFPNPWTLRVSGMGGYTSKCEKSQNHCTLMYSIYTALHARIFTLYILVHVLKIPYIKHTEKMVKICQTWLPKLNFETRPKKNIFRFLPKISAGHWWSWKNCFANFQILGPLGCQGWVVIPQNVKKSQNHCTLRGSQGFIPA